MNNENTTGAPLNESEAISNVWMLVEIFGHTKVAGRVSERKFGTQVMLQVDIPGIEGIKASKLYGISSIFSLSPVSEKYCRDFTRKQEEYGYDLVPYVQPSKQLTEPFSTSDKECGEDEEPFI